MQQAHQLIYGQRQKSEHEMAEHLVMAPHPGMAAAEPILKAGANALGGGALTVPDILGERAPHCAPRGRLELLRQLARLRTGMEFDDRHLLQLRAVRPDLGRVVGAVHQVAAMQLAKQPITVASTAGLARRIPLWMNQCPSGKSAYDADTPGDRAAHHLAETDPGIRRLRPKGATDWSEPLLKTRTPGAFHSE